MARHVEVIKLVAKVAVVPDAGEEVQQQLGGAASSCSWELTLAGASALRAAELARSLASALSSRRTWAIEKSSDRANFRQIQFKE
jgi:hypothetical protein